MVGMAGRAQCRPAAHRRRSERRLGGERPGGGSVGKPHGLVRIPGSGRPAHPGVARFPVFLAAPRGGLGPGAVKQRRAIPARRDFSGHAVACAGAVRAGSPGSPGLDRLRGLPGRLSARARHGGAALPPGAQGFPLARGAFVHRAGRRVRVRSVRVRRRPAVPPSPGSRPVERAGRGAGLGHSLCRPVHGPQPGMDHRHRLFAGRGVPLDRDHGRRPLPAGHRRGRLLRALFRRRLGQDPPDRVPVRRPPAAGTGVFLRHFSLPGPGFHQQALLFLPLRLPPGMVENHPAPFGGRGRGQHARALRDGPRRSGGKPGRRDLDRGPPGVATSRRAAGTCER